MSKLFFKLLKAVNLFNCLPWMEEGFGLVQCVFGVPMTSAVLIAPTPNMNIMLDWMMIEM